MHRIPANEMIIICKNVKKIIRTKKRTNNFELILTLRHFIPFLLERMCYFILLFLCVILFCILMRKKYNKRRKAFTHIILFCVFVAVWHRKKRTELRFLIVSFIVHFKFLFCLKFPSEILIIIWKQQTHINIKSLLMRFYVVLFRFDV